MKPPKKRPVKKNKSFGEREFVHSLWKTMKGQEKKNAVVGLIHERLGGGITMVGLTGGIASGKSTVASSFRKAGIPVVDADEIARAVVRKGKKAHRQIVQSFGEGILLPSGELDRVRLGEIVFADETKRSLLESITHPEISKEILKQVQGLKKKKKKVVIIDAALLFESGLHRQMHKNILIRLDPKEQLKRLMARDQLAEIDAWRRILSQMPVVEKEKLSDLVIDNSGSVQETARQIQSLIPQLLK